MLKPYMAEIVGEGRCFRDLQGFIARVARCASPVLVLGEAGTGKEVAARAIHFQSRRKNHPFVSVDAALYYERELERELFGHVEPATGKVARKGLLEFANRGTCFISNVEEASEVVQGRVSRLIESGSFQRVGSDTSISSKARIVISSSKDIRSFAEGGLFNSVLLESCRETVTMPPLRDRPEDIVPFVRHIAHCFSVEQLEGVKIKVTREALDALRAYVWPGNYDELKTEILRVLRGGQRTIRREDLAPEIAHFARVEGLDSSVRHVIEELENAMEEFRIMCRLDAEYGNVLLDEEDWDFSLKCFDRNV